MLIANRPKPQPGETWMDLKGQTFKILAVNTDPISNKEYVLCRDTKNYCSLWELLMDEIMATMGGGEDTLMCYYQKIERV